MKKTILLLLWFSLLSCLSISLSAQSPENELDQVELAKQWVGTWETSIDKDSVIRFVCTPFGSGLYFHMEWKADGKTYFAAHSVLGFSRNRETLIMSHVWQGGNSAQEIGRFVTDKKLMMERFLPDQPNHAVALSELDFSQPNVITWEMLGRGSYVTWEPTDTYKWTFSRVND